MEKFKDVVPFDPGYYKISFQFSQQIAFVASGYVQQKSPNQKKFQLIQAEPIITDLIDKSAAFFLGCLLWGGFLKSRFPQGKSITGNTTDGLSQEDLNDLDCAIEAKSILEFISFFNRDCNYFLKRKSKVSDFVVEIMQSYIEFAQLNNNFIGVNNTHQINLPKRLAHFEKMSVESLDELCEKIYSIIESKKIESLLELGFCD